MQNITSNSIDKLPLETAKNIQRAEIISRHFADAKNPFLMLLPVEDNVFTFFNANDSSIEYNRMLMSIDSWLTQMSGGVLRVYDTKLGKLIADAQKEG